MGEKEQYANETEKARAIVNATMAEFGLTAAKEVDTDIAATPDSGEQKKETELLADVPVLPIEEATPAHSSPQEHEVAVNKEREEEGEDERKGSSCHHRLPGFIVCVFFVHRKIRVFLHTPNKLSPTRVKKYAVLRRS